jgi:hypothetical protein
MHGPPELAEVELVRELLELAGAPPEVGEHDEHDRDELGAGHPARLEPRR